MFAERSVTIATTPGTRSLPVVTRCKMLSHALLKSLPIVILPLKLFMLDACGFQPTGFWSAEPTLGGVSARPRPRI
jgi:hypothetical protein